MVTNFLWGTVGSVMHLLTTELNSLANGAGSAIGPEINNSGGYQQGMLSLHLGSAAFTASSYVQVLLIPSTDLAGAAYPTSTAGASIPASNYLAGVIYIYPSTAAHDEMLLNVTIPPGKWKAVLVNNTGVALAASGNTLDLYPTPTQY